jgi:hypothetical protein
MNDVMNDVTILPKRERIFEILIKSCDFCIVSSNDMLQYLSEHVMCNRRYTLNQDNIAKHKCSLGTQRCIESTVDTIDIKATWLSIKLGHYSNPT